MSRENTDRKYNLIVKHMHTNWYIMKNIDLQDGIWNHNPLKLNLCCNARRLSIRNITVSCCEFKFDHPVVFTFCTGPSKTSHSHWRSKIKAISFHFRCQIYVLLHQKLSEYQSFPFVTVQADILHSFSGRRFVFISTQLSYMFSAGLSHPCFFSCLHICHLQDGKLNILWDLESSLWNAVLPSCPGCHTVMRTVFSSDRCKYQQKTFRGAAEIVSPLRGSAWRSPRWFCSFHGFNARRRDQKPADSLQAFSTPPHMDHSRSHTAGRLLSSDHLR